MSWRHVFWEEKVPRHKAIESGITGDSPGRQRRCRVSNRSGAKSQRELENYLKCKVVGFEDGLVGGQIIRPTN